MSTAAERKSQKSRRTTQTGYVNHRGQVVIRNTGLRGTDYGQWVYQLGCSVCGHVYGANGSDIHLRRCPMHDRGAPGLPYEPGFFGANARADSRRRIELR
jgi:hypothetical protein